MRDYGTILQGVLSSTAGVLTQQGRPAGRVGLVPGLQEAWDDCCAGMLYIRTIEVYPTMGSGTPFPQMDTAQKGCTIHGVAVHIGLGLVRCAATLDDQGNPPPARAVEEDALVALDDMATLLDVLLCQASKEPGVVALKVDRWQPKGVQGGCHGGEWGAYLLVDPCVCKPIPES